nr:MAG TPA: pentapeptide repeat protein [Caudoviricetes sp.]
MKQEELNKILDKHELWVKSCATKGKQADLSGEHLEGLAFDDRALSQASFRGAYLDGAKFIDAILVGVDFEGARLTHADFSCANAWEANFNKTNCQNSLFLSANLTEASFEGADLDGASFALAYLSNASLSDAQLDGVEFKDTFGVFPVCPEEGEFTGWTLAEEFDGTEYLLRVSVPWTARRSSGTTRRCRAEALSVDEVISLDTEKSYGFPYPYITLKNRDFKLRLGETSTDDNFETDRFKTSSTDLYFWISKEEALAQARRKI